MIGWKKLFMKSRIFTFGCSFTEYEWPTWADIILYKNIRYIMNIGKEV
jgi:hypothetical protein